jgi:hypothetical protein
MICRSLTRLAAFAVLAAFAAPARAQDAAGAMGNNCMMQQLSQLCSAKPGTPEFSVCAKQHTGDAMAACSQQSSAAGAAAAGKPTSPCMDDAQKYCAGKWPGSPEFMDCMHSHQSQLTPACAAYAKKRSAEKPKAGDDVCVADAKKVCPGLTIMDREKFTTCMTKNYDSLSPSCQAKFKGLKKESDGPHGECMAGLQKLCPDLKPGDQGSMMQCMMAHREDMPPSCHNHGKPSAQ